MRRLARPGMVLLYVGLLAGVGDARNERDWDWGCPGARRRADGGLRYPQRRPGERRSHAATAGPCASPRIGPTRPEDGWTFGWSSCRRPLNHVPMRCSPSPVVRARRARRSSPGCPACTRMSMPCATSSSSTSAGPARRTRSCSPRCLTPRACQRPRPMLAWERGSATPWTTVDADPRFYTSTVAADDLDDVRAALGYDRIDLYGTSYGGTLVEREDGVAALVAADRARGALGDAPIGLQQLEMDGQEGGSPDALFDEPRRAQPRDRPPPGGGRARDP